MIILKEQKMKETKVLDYAPAPYQHLDFIVGLDEVGRGCGAGPVVTAAVILPKGFSSPLLRDSKKLTEKQRNIAYQLILDNAISVSCQAGSVKDINEIGINPATFKTMHKCLDELSIKPQHILVDGIVWEEYKDIAVSKVPKGDDTYLSIAAAAIVAKVRRDEYMVKLHELYPIYDWDSNKGYLSPKHIAAIKEKGVCKYHRNQYVRNFI
jgi:ribonuclease HII